MFRFYRALKLAINGHIHYLAASWLLIQRKKSEDKGKIISRLSDPQSCPPVFVLEATVPKLTPSVSEGSIRPMVRSPSFCHSESSQLHPVLWPIGQRPHHHTDTPVRNRA